MQTEKWFEEWREKNKNHLLEKPVLLLDVIRDFLNNLKERITGWLRKG